MEFRDRYYEALGAMACLVLQFSYQGPDPRSLTEFYCDRGKKCGDWQTDISHLLEAGFGEELPSYKALKEDD
jgi:hypothetical protein